jgi:hypothetical protein
MSLLNDALKRTRQAQQQQEPTPTAPVTPPLPPVEVAPQGGLSWSFPVAAILLVAVACLFIVFAFFFLRKPGTQITTVPQNAQTPQTVAMVLPKTPPALVSTQAVTAPPKPLPPTLKLQGIFYNDAKWQAIVNGQSVLVGDSVNGYRVKLISKNDVSFLAPDGTEKTLSMGN